MTPSSKSNLNLAKKCFYCKKEAIDPQFRPFCSKRCKQIDLGRWLSGTYAIPTEEESIPASHEED